jgi:hypothetical protein
MGENSVGNRNCVIWGFHFSTLNRLGEILRDNSRSATIESILLPPVLKNHPKTMKGSQVEQPPRSFVDGPRMPPRSALVPSKRAKQSSPPRTAGSPLRDVMAYGLCAGRSSIGRSNFSHDAIIGLPYINDAKLTCMSTSERLLRAVQFNTITALRNRLGSEQFIEWLITPCHRDGMTPVEALESGLWQEVAELAENALSEGVAQF